MSFSLASAELNVTPAAISHQIKLLETHLGVPLFVRLTRKLQLTAAGERLMPEVSEAFSKIKSAVLKVNPDTVNDLLTLRLGPSLAARWLSPRLHLFWRQFPDIDLRLYHSNSPVDFDREDIDLAITYGSGHWPGVIASPLLDIDFFPVCSPTLLGAEPAKATASLLLEHTLLHDTHYDDWEAWLKQSDIPKVNPRRGIIIDDTNVLIQAALDGQGIALCSTLFVKEYIDSGRLVRLFDTELKNSTAYYIVCPKTHLQRPAVLEVKNWLLSQGPLTDSSVCPR